jgi:hypothetical protein
VKVSAKDKEAAETKNRIPNSDPMNMTAREPHVGHGGLVSVPPAGVVRKEEVEQIEETKGAQAMKASGVKQSSDKLLARTGMNIAHKFPRKGQTDLGNIPGMNTPGVSKDTADYAEKRRGDREKQLKPAIKTALGTHGPKGKLPEEVESQNEATIAGLKGWQKIKGTDKQGNVKDKSGAVHTPMSRAKDLARQSLKKLKSETMMGKISN